MNSFHKNESCDSFSKESNSHRQGSLVETNKGKPKGAKLGASASNLLASMPWLKNKAFLVPALAAVLVLSTVGVVSAVQGGVFGPSDQESAEASLEESSSEEQEQPAIGFACVKGTVVCEEVKSILLDTDYEEVLRNWTRQSLIQYLVDTQYVSLNFATEVVDAVRFDWGDGSTYAGGSETESDEVRGSSSSTARPATTCSGGVRLCNAVKEIFGLGHFDYWVKEDLVSYLMRTYSVSKAVAEAAIKSTGYVWGGTGSSASGTSSLPRTELPQSVSPPVSVPQIPPVSGTQSGLSPSEIARSTIDSINAFGSAYSRLRVIDYMVDLYGIGRTEATSALDELGINWNLQAAKAATWFATQEWTSYRSRIGFIDILTDDREKWTASQAQYAVDSLGIDWNVNASRAAVEILEYFDCNFFVENSEFGPSALVEDLAGYIIGTYDFTEDEAFYGAFDQMEEVGDWTWKIYPNCVP